MAFLYALYPTAGQIPETKEGGLYSKYTAQPNVIIY